MAREKLAVGRAEEVDQADGCGGGVLIDDAIQLRLLYSQRDFQIALSALTFLSEIELEVHYPITELRRFRCYLDTAAISYWRPFSKSPNLPSLKTTDLHLCAIESDLHEPIHVYRDKVVAHSDIDYMRVGFHTFDVLDGISFPHLRFDEALELTDQIDPWMSLIRKIMHIGTERLWEIAQTVGPGKSFIKHFRDP